MTEPQQIVDHWPQIEASFASEGVTITQSQALNVLPKLVAALQMPISSVPEIDISVAQIVNAPDVRGWAETTRITEVTFDRATTRINFTKRDGDDRWPDVRPPGWLGDLQYTIWLFLKMDGHWCGSAFIQMWHGRDGSGSVMDPDIPSRYHDHWYYGTRWSPMQTHGPIKQGEPIGFMVTSGNCRDSVGPFGPMERSNAVVVQAVDIATYIL